MGRARYRRRARARRLPHPAWHASAPADAAASAAAARASSRGDASGIGYGAASLGCTLPLFLTLIGASLSGGGKITTFLAYGAGMAVVLMALSVLVALAREGAARAVRPLLSHMNRIAGLLLLASGGYLFYYWARLRFGDTATVADDPIVSFGVRFSGQARNFADGNGSLILVGAGAIVALALLVSLWQRHRRVISTGLVRP
jgi:cytochrome c-type biogenesis protein